MGGEVLKTVPTVTLSSLGCIGVYIRRLSCEAAARSPARYRHIQNKPHIDNFYQLFVLTSGSLTVQIDSTSVTVHAGQILTVMPGQIHSYTTEEGAEGFILGLEMFFIPRMMQLAFRSRVARLHSQVSCNEQPMASLATLLEQLLLFANDSEAPHDLVTSLARSCMHLIDRAYRDGSEESQPEEDAAGVFNAFLSLLMDNMRTVKSPGEYARRLGITATHLTRLTKAHTGKTAGEMIRSEIMLEAKRLLYFSPASIEDIARDLGYTDPSYFSRLFTKIEGISPSEFRTRNR